MMTESPAMILTKVVEHIIAIEKGGQANFKRTYTITNESNSKIKLAQQPSFKAQFDIAPVNIKLIEEVYSQERVLHTRPVYLGIQEVSWHLQKSTLDPRENYHFDLTWEHPHLVAEHSKLHFLQYTFRTEQVVQYELIVRLPSVKDMISTNPDSYPANIWMRISNLFERIQVNSTMQAEPEESQGHILLKHQAQVSQNNPFRVQISYWMAYSPRVIFFWSLVSGLIAGLTLEILGSWIYDSISNYLPQLFN